MAFKDWGPRTRAIKYFELELAGTEHNHQDGEMFEAALSALKRSQDHTAIQTRITETMRALRALVKAIDEARLPWEEIGDAQAVLVARNIIAQNDDPTLPRSYWGFRHGSTGECTVYRFYGDREAIDAAMQNRYIASVVEPFEAADIGAAYEHVKQRASGRARNAG